jgi:hypothetical protein
VFKRFSRDAKFRLFLLVLSAAAVFLILLTTSKYGAGVSSDAARNLSTADSLLAGKGFVDMLGSPFVLWPPLYPLVLAGLSIITRLGTFQVAWYLNVLLYAVNVWLSGWLLYRVFPDRLIYAVAGSLIILLSRSMLRIYANVASEPLFATLMLLFFLAAARYLGVASRSMLWLMCVLAGLAVLQRYLGVVLFGVTAVVVFYRERWRGLRRAALPGVVSALPLAAWAVFHNIPISGAPFGPRDLGEMLPLQNISLSLTKILWWFIPRLSITDPLILRPWIVLMAVALVLILLNKRPDWMSWLRSLSNVYLWPALLFSLVYFLLLAFTVVTADHLDLTSDRYYVILLPAVVALVFVTLDRLVVSHVRGPRLIAGYALPALLFAWFIYPVYSLQAYIREALVRGEPTNYNIANSSQFRDMKVVRAAEPILARDPEAVIYSNYINVVWFIFGHPVRALPFQDQTKTRDQRVAALQQHYAGWPAEEGYIVWFTPNQYHHIADPTELATFAKLKLVYEDKTGQIYIVEPGK